jgi:hypothetical protein
VSAAVSGGGGGGGGVRRFVVRRFGPFRCEENAARAHDIAARREHGDRATTNFS